MLEQDSLLNILHEMFDFSDELDECRRHNSAIKMRNKIDRAIEIINTSTNPIEKIKKFQTDRLLDKQNLIWSNEAVNILEELFEMLGLELDKEKRNKLKTHLREYIKQLVDDGYFKSHTNKDSITTDFEIVNANDFCKKGNCDEIVDGFADIIVFSIGAIMKLGYEPECVLKEVAKEINSRVGSIVDGKFQKDLSKKYLWYKANYKKCFKGKQ